MGCRIADLRKALRSFGLDVVESGRGRHPFKVRRANGSGPTYPLKAHNGLKSELADCYVEGICDLYGIDEKALRAKL